MATRAHDAIAIIPARLGSTRLPRKALLDRTGEPLVVHVCRRAEAAPRVRRVVVATDAAEIVRAVEAAGFEAVLTSPEHVNGTSRLAEAAERLGLEPDEMVVNVQGDEPEIDPAVIDGAVEAASWSDVRGGMDVGTVASPIEPGDAAERDPNVVKAVVGEFDGASGVGPALYFSRATVPHDRDGAGGVQRYRHVGIYAYRVRALAVYTSLAETPAERAERLEQLRWLEHGFQIAASIRASAHAGIDTAEQYEAFVARFRAGEGA